MPDIKNNVRETLIAYVYSQTNIGLLTSLLCASVILVGLYSTEKNTVLLSWYGFFLLVTLARFILSACYQRFYATKDMSLWRNLFIFGAFIGGVSWGLTGALLLPIVTPTQQTLLILILTGVTAGSVPLLSAVLGAAIAFLAPALLLLIVSLAFFPNYLFFDVSAGFYFAYLIVLSIKTHQLMRRSIDLQFENSALIADLLALKNKLEYSATHDALTDVANRNLYNVHIKNAILRAKRNNKMVCLLYIDLDNFKQINDQYGHPIGDKLLLAVIARFRHSLRETDIISRLGGDEFTIILENITNLQYTREITQIICNIIAQPFDIDGLTLAVTTSIGISVYPMDSLDADELLRLADKAMYYAKEHGRNKFYFSLDLEKKTETGLI